MYLAINYSTQAAALLHEGRIQIDRFKCPPWPDMIAEASPLCPVAVHFELKAGNAGLRETNWAPLHAFLEETGTPFINLHLNPTIKHYPGFSVDTTQPNQVERVIQQMIEDVNAVVDEFGAPRVIVENVPYRGLQGKVLRPAVEPQVILQVLNATGCGLLLDISHARIAAHHLGMDEKVYLAQLPTDRLRELHFTGLHNLNGRLQDHLEILETDWPCLDWVLERIRTGEWNKPWMLAFEYGGVGEKFAAHSDPQVIAEQVPLLYRRVRDI
ncbi:MAG: DUF692 family protein [Anaerolineales bacterium]|nr:DUF692 family protein [Anaerolineales bacterium]